MWLMKSPVSSIWKKTIAVTWGGTGGHITPLVSLLDYLHTSTEFTAKCNKIYWFWEENSLEERSCRWLHGVEFIPVPSGKLRRYRTLNSVILNLIDLWKVCVGICIALRKVRSLNIEVVFGKWWHVSFPLCFAARVLGRRVILHESDLHPGLANRMLYPFASIVFTGFEQSFPKTRYIGQILSLHLFDPVPESFSLPPVSSEKTIVLVLGWSQWAKTLFDAIKHIIDTRWHIVKDITFILTLGTKNAEYKDIFTSYEQVYTYEYLNTAEMWALYSIGDISITRGGVTSLAEQKLFGIKSCIVPLPYTGGNHQRWNAQRYVKKYDDVCVTQDVNLESNLIAFLEQYTWYKKQHTQNSKDPLKKVYKTILKEICRP